MTDVANACGSSATENYFDLYIIPSLYESIVFKFLSAAVIGF